MKKKLVTRKSSGRGSQTQTSSARAPRFPIRLILVPVDFSEPSKAALEYSTLLAKQFGAKLVLLHVIEPVATPDFAYYPLMMENEKVVAAAKDRLNQIKARNEIDAGLLEQTLVRNGTPFHEITSAAESLNVDLIVISTHGYTGLKHVMLGSTTERVVRHAICPVLVVRC